MTVQGKGEFFLLQKKKTKHKPKTLISECWETLPCTERRGQCPAAEAQHSVLARLLASDNPLDLTGPQGIMAGAAQPVF